MKNKNVLIFGKDQNSTAQPIELTGSENNVLKIMSIKRYDLFKKILKELKKFNMQMALITNNEISKIETEEYKKAL